MPQDALMDRILACRGAVLPGGRSPLLPATGARAVGWIPPERVDAMRDCGLVPDGDAWRLAPEDTFEALGRRMAQAGLYAPHDELFDVREDGPEHASPVHGRIDRGALPKLGIIGWGAHLNGLVRKPSGLHLWLGRRARDKRLDPGKLDHLVAGGVPSGLTPDEALIKEAQEEASIAPDLICQARRVGRLSYALERPEGLRRDVLFCYDLDLPESFHPIAADGEVESFELVPLGDALALVRDTDEMKFNVSLVLIDLFLRHGLVRDARLRAALDAP